MLDLDALAENRARALQQAEEDWRSAIWSPEFQKLSQSMSDGEVEDFVSCCSSQKILLSAARFLLANLESSGASPYAFLLTKAQESGLTTAQWIESQFMNGHRK